MTMTLLDAEYATVGSFLHAPAFLAEVQPWLRPEDFANPTCRGIFNLLLDMHSRGAPIDAITVLAACRASGLLRVDGTPGLQIVEMLQAAAHPVLCETYARIVLDNSIRRRLVEVGERLIQIGESPVRAPAEVLDLAREQYGVLHAERLRWRAARANNADTPQVAPLRHAPAESNSRGPRCR